MKPFFENTCGKDKFKKYIPNSFGYFVYIKSFYYIKQSGVLIFQPLIKAIISNDVTCVDYHEMRQSLLLYFCGTIGLFFLYNKQNNTWMFGNTKLFLVLNRISHSFALLTREIFWSTLEINFIFPHIHVLFFI